MGSIKSTTQLTSGEGVISQRVQLKSVDQKILSSKNWVDLFNDPNNKNDLIKLVFSYFQTDDGRNLLEIPIVAKKFEDLDTRLHFHGAISKVAVLITTKDTDLFLILIYALYQ